MYDRGLLAFAIQRSVPFTTARYESTSHSALPYRVLYISTYRVLAVRKPVAGIEPTTAYQPASCNASTKVPWTYPGLQTMVLWRANTNSKGASNPAAIYEVPWTYPDLQMMTP